MAQLLPKSIDVLTPEQRHRCMSRIRSSNTRPERIVRRFLFACGMRFRKKCENFARHPRHRVAQVSHRDICKWLFLAWARSLQILSFAKVEHSVLARQNQPQPPA